MRFKFSSAGEFVPCLKDSELAEGQMKGMWVAGKPVLLARQGGQVFAVSNVCPHMGCALDKGILREC